MKYDKQKDPDGLAQFTAPKDETEIYETLVEYLNIENVITLNKAIRQMGLPQSARLDHKLMVQGNLVPDYRIATKYVAVTFGIDVYKARNILTKYHIWVLICIRSIRKELWKKGLRGALFTGMFHYQIKENAKNGFYSVDMWQKTIEPLD